MPRKDEIKLSPAEWELMRISWQKGKSTARVIYEASLQEKERGYQTIKTMLDRLVEKGVLRRERFGPLWLYEARISQEKATATAIDRFVHTVLDGAVAPLFAHFVRSKQLSAEEIEQLKALIDKEES
ncbi:MAG: BlaI/MecI/CopY family transcriptional regulator [bacterium]|jgi:BlaI family penicillinase repressor|nr:BlaI/MecI/CopY family transcriptional regulator [bacterium]